MAVTADQLRRLASERHGRPITTCYLDVDGRRNPRPADYERHLANLRRDAEELVAARAGGRRDRVSVRSDLERMETWLAEGNLDRRTARGLAFFACSAEGYFEAVQLPFEVANAVAVDDRPHVAELEMRLREQRSYGIVLVDREKVRVLRLDATGLRDAGRLVEEIRSRHQRGGWEAPQVRAHVDEQARAHLVQAAETVRRELASHRVDHVLLGGPREVVGAFEPMLDEAMRGLVVGTVSVGVSAPDAEVRAAAEVAAVEHRERRTREQVERLRAAVDGEEPAVTGLDDVLRELVSKRVEIVLLADGYSAPGWACPACGLLRAGAGDGCPACGAVMERRDEMVEDLVARALEDDAPVERIGDGSIDWAGRVAAILRY